MAQKFAQSLKLNRGYVPSQPVAGEANDTVFMGENIVFKGFPQQIYAEVFRGTTPVMDADPDIPGGPAPIFIPAPVTHPCVATFTNGRDEIVKVGLGVFPQTGTTIIIDDKLYLLTQILGSNVAKISPVFEGADGDRVLMIGPTLCAMNDLLGVCYSGGNAVSLPQGHILTAGITLRLVVIGNPAPSESARTVLDTTITDDVSLVPRSETTGLFEAPRLLGLDKPPPLTLVATASGTKNMPAGRYSMRIARGSLETAGYGNPSEATEITITAGQRIEATFPTPVPVGKQTSWRVFASLYSVAEGITGPWYEIEEVAETDIAAASRVRIYEWRDYEIAGSQLVTFDNDLPPKASFVVMFGGSAVLVSALGSQTAGGIPVAPGPSVQPSKGYNPEGFPAGAALAMGPVQDIVSFVEGEGRLYLATSSYIHIVTLTGNPDQPLTVRPFVQCAIVRHNAFVYVQGALYAFSAKGPIRVSGEGTGAEDRIFAAPVRAVTEKWSAARVFVVYDPHNESILWVHANDSLTPNGKWRTMVLSYSLPLGLWSTPLWIEDVEPINAETHPFQLNMVVTGVATLGGRAYMVTSEQRLLIWDAGAHNQRWYLATPFIDQPSSPGQDKNIRRLSVTHRGMSSKIGVFGIQAGGSEPSLTADVSTSFTGAITLPNAGQEVTTTPVSRINVRNLRLYAIKVQGIDAATNTKHDRVDEIILDGNVHGPTT